MRGLQIRLSWRVSTDDSQGEKILALGIEGLYTSRGLLFITVFIKQHPLNDHPLIFKRRIVITVSYFS